MSAFHKGLGVIALLTVSACATTLQTTSGADYLAGYDDTWQAQCSAGTGNVDADVRAIAAVEPNLRFPARIGIARLEYGTLVGLPADDQAIWAEAGAALGPSFGEFVPVSPLIVSMVAPQPARGSRTDTADVIGDIRRGAARQHLDYVFVYSVTAEDLQKGNALSLADLSIIGLFVLPSRDLKVEAAASGLMLDVRNGYPYATITTFAEEKGWARAAYSYGKTREMVDSASDAALAELVEDAADALKALAGEAEE